MTSEDTYYDQKHARVIEYGERPLDPSRSIIITASDDYLKTPAGVTAAIVASSLLARMSPKVALGYADTAWVDSRGSHHASLHQYILPRMQGADVQGNFEVRTAATSDYRFHLGPDGSDQVIHGDAWNAYVGPGPSPLASSHSTTTFGAAFSVVLAAAQLFKEPFRVEFRPQTANLLDWSSEPTAQDPARDRDIGTVWFPGAGSVGTAAIYFMILEGLAFDPWYFDFDVVKLENVDRSPIFEIEDQLHLKVDSVKRFLDQEGVSSHPVPTDLASSEEWRGRQQGTPDVLVSAANEKNVRAAIEESFPPVQIYATTGSNWQATLLRHIPGIEPCSCCVFKPEGSAPMKCATDMITDPETGEKHDAALPFLSYAAGLMTAAELAKLSLPGFRDRASRVAFQPLADDPFMIFPASFRVGCLCHDRSEKVHRAMLSGSKYSEL